MINLKIKNLKIIIEQILTENYFLHFAGTLSDATNVWKIKNILSIKRNCN